MCGTRSACCVSSTDAAGHAGIGAGSVARAGAGFTLIELMWAMTLSLVVMAAVASLFGVFTRSLTAAQAAADLSARLRTAAWRLRQDLTGVTVDLMPPVRPESESGYFEYFEGWRKDGHAAFNRGGQLLVADVDDVLMFTTRSEGQPFVGRFGDGTIESPVAEVAWFCRPSTVQPLDGMTLFTLYRREKLVMPYVGRAPFDGTNSTGAASFDLNLHDLSLRLEGNVLIPNSLGDLTKRENRFLRGGQGVSGTVFPYVWATPQPVVSGTLTGTYRLAGPEAILSGSRAGEDVVLSNVLSFDVLAYDAEVRSPLATAVQVRCETDQGQSRVKLNVGGANVMDPVLMDPYAYTGFLYSVLGASVSANAAFPAGATIAKQPDGSVTHLLDWPCLTMDRNAAVTSTVTLTFAAGTCLPGDNRYFGATSGTGAPGGYVDLGWGGDFTADGFLYPSRLLRYSQSDLPRQGALSGRFIPPSAVSAAATFPPAGRTAFQSGGMRVRSGTLATGLTALDGGDSRTYDTWSTHYESNGVDDDSDGKVDQGTNGIDDSLPPDGVPDDPDEAETFAPYPVRLRGLEVRIRCYDPASKQIRQTTLRHSFLSR